MTATFYSRKKRDFQIHHFCNLFPIISLEYKVRINFKNAELNRFEHRSNQKLTETLLLKSDRNPIARSFGHVFETMLSIIWAFVYIQKRVSFLVAILCQSDVFQIKQLRNIERNSPDKI